MLAPTKQPGIPSILVIMLKIIWKKLDFLLLFVRYSFIMIPNSDL